METIKRGSKGADVKTLQLRLNLMADGIFGPLTEEAVKEFQKANGLAVDGIVGPKTWEKLGITSSSATIKVSKRNIKEIIVHCSATPADKDYTTDDIKKWHLARGFSDIGYHYVIYRDGSIHNGRDVNVSGAHCTGHNTISIGVCYIGGLKPGTNGTKASDCIDSRTSAQKESLLKLLKELKKLYPGVRIYGHRDFANKACPCFDAKKEYSGL